MTGKAREAILKTKNKQFLFHNIAKTPTIKMRFKKQPNMFSNVQLAQCPKHKTTDSKTITSEIDPEVLLETQGDIE